MYRFKKFGIDSKVSFSVLWKTHPNWHVIIPGGFIYLSFSNFFIDFDRTSNALFNGIKKLKNLKLPWTTGKTSDFLGVSEYFEKENFPKNEPNKGENSLYFGVLCKI